jgi:hypothetical protein
MRTISVSMVREPLSRAQPRTIICSPSPVDSNNVCNADNLHVHGEGATAAAGHSRVHLPITKNVIILCHRLNMELDLQSLFGLLCTAVLETPQLPPLPPHLGSYTRALSVSQDRRHLLVTPCCTVRTENLLEN